MREKIAKLIYRNLPTGSAYAKKEDIADQILSLFREEIEKLKLLSPEELATRQEDYIEPDNESIGYERNIAQAQLTKTKEDLRKVME